MKKSILKKISLRTRKRFNEQLKKDMPKIVNTIQERSFSDIIDDFRHFQPARKVMRIELELEYPGCDHYSTLDTVEFLKENIQDYLNQNLSDGDDRLKMTNLTVSCENVKYTIL